MNKMVLLVLSIAVPLWTSTVMAQQPSQPFLFGLWEGTVTVIPETTQGSTPAVFPFQGQQMPLVRLDVRKTNLVMYFQTENGLTPMGEGSDLRLNEQGRSAVVIAALQPGGATETWMVNIARWDEETIAVHVSRVTSGAEGSQPPSSFAAFGQMRRVANGD